MIIVLDEADPKSGLFQKLGGFRVSRLIKQPFQLLMKWIVFSRLGLVSEKKIGEDLRAPFYREAELYLPLY